MSMHLLAASLLISCAIAVPTTDLVVPESTKGMTKFINTAETQLVQGAPRIGVFRIRGQEKYLRCDLKGCAYRNTYAEGTVFEVPDYDNTQGHQMIDHVSRNCLDREHCSSGTSTMRLSECNHCGAQHWKYEPIAGLLAEDWMKNAVSAEPSGYIHHTDDGKIHPAKLELASQEPCDPKTIELKGRWEFFGDGVGVTFTEELATTDSMGWTHTKANANTASWGLSLKIKFFGANLGHSTTTTITDAFTSSFSSTHSTTCSVSFASPGGPRWRWAWTMVDQCGDSSGVKSCTFVESTKTPACPPGTFDYNDKTFQTCLDKGLQNLGQIDAEQSGLAVRVVA